jgi:hypothetical protein
VVFFRRSGRLLAHPFFLPGIAIRNVSLSSIVHFLTPDSLAVLRKSVLTVFFDWHGY